MEEVEAPTEALTEEIHHAAHSGTSWNSQVALSSALIAGLAAVTAMLANHHANEAMIEQIQASDQWGYYQAKGVKAAVLSAKVELLGAIRKSGSSSDQEKIERYRDEQKEVSEKARKLEEESESHLRKHGVLARGVTLFQLAIAVAAISVLTRSKRFWYLGLLFGAFGVGFLIQSIFFVN
jgi:hypothetical protein